MSGRGHPVLEAIATRRSVGRVALDPLPRETVARLVEAALRAPNHGLTRPWRFVVLTGDARAEVSPRLERAPVVIVAIARPADDPVQAREDRDAVAAGVQNMLLAAHALGLGAMWRTGPLAEDPAARDALRLVPGEAIVAYVYVGRPPDGPAPPPTPRPAVDEVTEWRGW